MKSKLLILILIIIFSYLSCSDDETNIYKEPIYMNGNLNLYIDNIVRNEYPKDKSGIYTYVDTNSGVIKNLKECYDKLLINDANEYINISSKLAKYNQDLVIFSDDNGYNYAIIKELAPYKYGYGTYIILLNNDNAINTSLIEIPHPLFDYNTYEVGLYVFQNLPLKTCLISGAHRYSKKKDACVDDVDPSSCYLSDVTRNVNTLFHQFHLLLQNKDMNVFQIHGFAVEPNDPDVILSSGRSYSEIPEGEYWQPSYIYQYPPDTNTSSLFAFFTKAGLYTKIFEINEDIEGINKDDLYDNLSATPNVQGKAIRSINGKFFHIELSTDIRTNLDKYKLVFEGINNYLMQFSN